MKIGKLDRRKLRPEALKTAKKPKASSPWSRYRYFKQQLTAHKADLIILIEAGLSVGQIASKLIEAGLPTITEKTLIRHLKDIVPDTYEKHLGRKTKSKIANAFTCPLSNLNNAAQIDIKSIPLSIQQNTTSQVTNPPPPAQKKETKEEQKPVINIENLNTLEDVERLFFDYSVKVEPNLLRNNSNNPKKHLQSFIDDMNFSGGFVITQGSWLKYFNEEHSPYMTALLEQAYSKGFISEENWVERRNRKGARQGIKAFLDSMNIS